MSKGKILGIGALATIFTSVAALPLYSQRVTEREMAVQTDLGNVERVITEPGLYFHIPFKENIDDFPLTVNITKVEQQTGNNVNAGNVVTSDNQPVNGGLIVHWKVSNKKGDPAAVYTDYAANGGDFEEIMDEIVRGHALGALVTVMGQQSSINLSSNIQNTMKDIKKELQDRIDEAGVPVEVTTLIQNGIGLEKSARERLQKIMVAQQENEVLDQRAANAEKATDVMKKEAQNMAEMFSVMTKAGASEATAAKLICLQLASGEDTVNKPFTPGCMGGQSPQATVAKR